MGAGWCFADSGRRDEVESLVMLGAGKRSFGKRLELPPAEPPPPVVPAREVPAIDPRTARKRVLQGGKLCFGDKLALTVDCIIHDTSEGGMRIQIQPGPTIPTEVTLVHLRAHIAYTATVAWQRRGSIGLKFVARHDLREPETPDMEVLRRYCVEHGLRVSASALAK
jgi:hypothetical protein